MTTQYTSSLPWITRGTTPTITFTTPFNANMIVAGFITFTLRGKIIFDVDINDEAVTVEDEAIKLKLTQEQTLMFDEDDANKVQIRLLLTTDDAVASNEVEIPIGGILREGEIQ